MGVDVGLTLGRTQLKAVPGLELIECEEILPQDTDFTASPRPQPLFLQTNHLMVKEGSWRSSGPVCSQGTGSCLWAS